MFGPSGALLNGSIHLGEPDNGGVRHVRQHRGAPPINPPLVVLGLPEGLQNKAGFKGRVGDGGGSVNGVVILLQELHGIANRGPIALKYLVPGLVHGSIDGVRSDLSDSLGVLDVGDWR
eukprot:14674364-Alexandrium_andersonii.AAC.1